ncbi:UNVERIFIED_CONTAM: hypothetical protein NCL1_06554 [Trichonephila clavipes]
MEEEGSISDIRFRIDLTQGFRERVGAVCPRTRCKDSRRDRDAQADHPASGHGPHDGGGAGRRPARRRAGGVQTAAVHRSGGEGQSGDARQDRPWQIAVLRSAAFGFGGILLLFVPQPRDGGRRQYGNLGRPWLAEGAAQCADRAQCRAERCAVLGWPRRRPEGTGQGAGAGRGRDGQYARECGGHAEVDARLCHRFRRRLSGRGRSCELRQHGEGDRGFRGHADHPCALRRVAERR